MLDAGKALVGAVGELHDAARLMAFFEAQLKQQGSSSSAGQQQHQQQQQQGLALSEDEQDYRHEGLAILLGTTGQYLTAQPDTSLQVSIVLMLCRNLKPRQRACSRVWRIVWCPWLRYRP